ncbi:MAG: hypothetical protein D6710_00170 [Nitrospirae bacterium]|nr:MAG: hypothetical protein D6710_00170 [Nitrospirota bacterium]
MTEVALKKRFIDELTEAERILFIRKAKELVYKEGYCPTDDLFYYCYFLILKERLRTAEPHLEDGLLRYIRAEAQKELEEQIVLYKSRLKRKGRGPSLRDSVPQTP